jgi:ATP-dependent helicase/nuclease subunit A
MTASQARAVDLGAVRWFLDTELGRLVRRRAGDCLRELPVSFVQRTEGGEELDAVMVRGRVDLLVPEDQGLILIDFKTDLVSRQAAPGRAAMYRSQVELYRRAVGEITGRRVTAAHLVFLAAHHIETL